MPIDSHIFPHVPCTYNVHIQIYNDKDFGYNKH